MLRTAIMDSPVGPLALTQDAAGRLYQVHILGSTTPEEYLRSVAEHVRDDSAATGLHQQLVAYFAGERVEFDCELAPRGTEFQRLVWAELRRIPYGATASYGELARRLGLPPGASRAVGAANGANPWAIVVPCHRVIGASGKLTGYAGGLEAKRALLELERGAGLFAGAG